MTLEAGSDQDGAGEGDLRKISKGPKSQGQGCEDKEKSLAGARQELAGYALHLRLTVMDTWLWVLESDASPSFPHSSFDLELCGDTERT